MLRPRSIAAVLGLALLGVFACHGASDAANTVEPSVDNARRAVDLRKAPPGGRESVVAEREALLARFREERGAGSGASPKLAGETEVAAAQPDDGLVLPVAAMLPQDCGYSDQNAPYGPIKEGTRVVLGRHREWQGNDNWASDMQVYVDREAVIRSLEGVDGAGCTIVRVDIDDGSWVWRIRDMRLPGMPSSAMAANSGEKLDPVVEARRQKTAQYLASDETAFALTVMHRRIGPKDEASEVTARERTYLATDGPAFDPKLGLYVVYARESQGEGWLMLGLAGFDSAVHHGGEHSAAVTLAVFEGKSWQPDAPTAAWSLNPGSRVDLSVDPAKAPGRVELVFVGSLRENDAGGVVELEGGFAVTSVPDRAKSGG